MGRGEGQDIQMKIKCTNCGAVYDINSASIPAKGRYAKCGNCQTRFLVKGKSGSKTAVAPRQSVKRNGLKKLVPMLAVGLIALLVILGVANYFLQHSAESRERRRIANNFLEALKTKKLTEANAWDLLEKYSIKFSALKSRDDNGIPQKDIFFPIKLIDYKFESEETIPRGFVRHESKVKPPPRPRLEEAGRRASTLEGVNGFFVQSNSEGMLFVIKGLVTNNLPDARQSIPIIGNLQSQTGTILRKKTVYAGVSFTENEIKVKSLRDMDKLLVHEPRNREVGPGQTVPFTVIFGSLPKDLSLYDVEAANPFLEFEKETALPPDKDFEALKKQIRKKNPKNLKIDDKNRVITYYDDEPAWYKLNYRLKLTGHQGKTLKKNGYVILGKGWDYYQIAEFKWE